MSVLGVMKEDGTGTGTYGIRLTLKESLAHTVHFRVSAAFRGRLQRSLSPIAELTVTDAPFKVSRIEPPSGPSGTLVHVFGTGFIQGDRLSISDAPPVEAIHTAHDQLSFIVPLGGSSTVVPLSTGPRSIAINGTAIGTFTVTALPPNPNPPGVVLSGAVSEASIIFGFMKPAIETAIAELRGSSADANARAYLNEVEKLLPAFDLFLANDFPLITSELDPGALSIVERMLVGSGPPTSVLRSGSASLTEAATLEGDAWLEERRPFIDNVNFFRGLSVPIGVIAVFGECTKVGLLGALSTATSTALDLAVSNYGRIGRFRVGDDPMLLPTLPTDFVSFAGGESKPLYAGVLVGRSITPVSPIVENKALKYLRDCGKAAAIALLPPASRLLVGQVNLFYEAIKALGFESDGAGLPLGPARGPLLISFGKIEGAFLGPGLAPCVKVESDGQALACVPGIVKWTDLWRFRIRGGWIDVGLEASTARVIDTLETTATTRELKLAKSGSGTGAVTSVPIGISCSTDCDDQTASFEFGSEVFLAAVAAADSSFVGWSSDCDGTDATVKVTLNRDRACTATFDKVLGVRQNPFGSKSIADGPFRVEFVNKALVPVETPEDVVVTLLRQVFSACNGLRFSSPRTVTIPTGASLATYDLAAGRDPDCSAQPIRTELTITAASLGSKVLDLRFIPSPQLKVSITR